MILVIVSKALYSSEGSYEVIVKAFSSFLNFFFFSTEHLFRAGNFFPLCVVPFLVV